MSAALHESSSFTASPPARVSSRTRWAGRIISGIAALLLALDAGVKLVGAKAAIEGSAQLGFAPDQVFIIGVIALVCLVLYLIPRTAPLGAVLWTGYFGGAIVTHLRAHNPLFTHILSGVYVAALLWIGLYLRDERVRALLGPVPQARPGARSNR